jgi:4-amino-4-deoxychorismate lyase
MNDGAIVSWLDGAPSTSLSVFDRGLQFGDGVFETMRFRRDRVDFLALHLDRLQRGLNRLLLPVAMARIESDLRMLCDEIVSQGIEDAVIKLIVTRGVAPRGYSPDLAKSASVILQVFPLDPRGQLHQQGVDVTMCRMRLADQPALAGIKHLNRIENVLARGEWKQEFHEGLMLSQQGDVIEGTMSNVFFVEGSASTGWVLHTPIIDRCGVSGVMRQVVLQFVASRSGMDVRESAISQARMQQFSAGFLTNAIIGIWPIKSLCGKPFEIVPAIRDIQDAVTQGAAESHRDAH